VFVACRTATEEPGNRTPLFSIFRLEVSMNAIATQQLTEIPFVLNKLELESELAIMDNGEPMAIMFKIPKIKSGFDKTIKFINRLKALIALNEMRSEAEERGFLSEEEIENEIQAARLNG
jgi:hypothetical protein